MRSLERTRDERREQLRRKGGGAMIELQLRRSEREQGSGEIQNSHSRLRKQVGAGSGAMRKAYGERTERARKEHGKRTESARKAHGKCTEESRADLNLIWGVKATSQGAKEDCTRHHGRRAPSPSRFVGEIK
eukprot:2390144-Pleurochrysis_carterae.AAC.1